jgi:23S rRNA pseudouridine1911/1915/1917 synthase
MLTVLYLDHHLIAVHKPVGLSTQAPAHVVSLESQVKDYIKREFAKPAGVYLGIPHRLDRPVEGIVLFCRNTKAAQRVAQQFHDHTIQKVYWAWVSGLYPEEESRWCDYLRKIPEQAKAELCERSDSGSKEAITHVRVLKRTDTSTLLELAPRTGRMHQLRLQAASRGFPIWGDVLYGSQQVYQREGADFDITAIALLARQLTLRHPFKHEPLTIESLIPPAFA